MNTARKRTPDAEERRERITDNLCDALDSAKLVLGDRRFTFFHCPDSACREVQRYVSDQTGEDLTEMTCEEKYDCPIHGLQDGPECARCEP